MMRIPRSTRLAVAAWLLPAACAPAVQRPVGERILEYRGRDVEAVLVDGRRVRLANPQVTADSVYGAWTAGSEPPTRVAVALADIRTLRVVSPTRLERETAREASVAVVRVLLFPVVLIAALVFGGPW